jgi:4-hydroxybenzoate polyprenyltransferase
MAETRPSMSAASRIAGWLGASHPYPLTMVLCLTALLAFASADGRPEVWRLLLLLISMFFSQLSIGWSNDYLDRENDARYQPSKPIPSGVVDARLMPLAILGVLGASLVAGALLGPLPLALLIAGTAAGLGYNLGIKDTRFSGLPYVLAFAALPPYVWIALDVYRDEFLLLYAVGTPLTLAAHLGNSIPDIETDRGAGRPGLAVSLGRESAMRVLALCLIAPLVIVALTLAWLEYELLLLTPAVAGYVLLAGAALLHYRRAQRDADLQAFRLLVLGCVLLAGGWLAAV